MYYTAIDFGMVVDFAATQLDKNKSLKINIDGDTLQHQKPAVRADSVSTSYRWAGKRVCVRFLRNDVQ